ncbi:nucleotidyl transferase AbiEii/AbiGii toxin family protein [Alcanivoracaceae bacterium MT1]
MDRNNPYYRQVALLLQVLPFVFRESCFALKGGTAINLFVRDLPRLSVDIDLVYLPDGDREQALPAIHQALDRIADDLEQGLAATVTRSYRHKIDSLHLTVERNNTAIKVELSPVMRGTVFPVANREVVATVEDEFGFAEVPVVALADLYAGKLCAAFDRQHPRDLFDVMLLLENEGIADQLRKAFLVYLISHPRPMDELLQPHWRPMRDVFAGEFSGMTLRPVTLEELRKAGTQALNQLLAQLTDPEKRFLCSLYQGPTDWTALGISGIEKLPAVQWKVRNIEKMTQEKRRGALMALRRVLSMGDVG